VSASDTASDTASFYDELAPFYHLLYGDWDEAVNRQGAALAGLLRANGIASGEPVHDAACGIGTQTLGLLRHGYRVSASDLSPGAIERLNAELARRNVSANVSVDDLRTLGHVAPGSLAAVIACDNSIPHLLSDAEVLRAFESCHRCLRRGRRGGFRARLCRHRAQNRRSPVRDAQPRQAPLPCRQVWEWDGDRYDLRLYLTTESPAGACETRVLHSRYYAVTIARLLELMTEAGFAEVERHDEVLFQPVLLGRANGP
jgi:SAM-dependent methyltransferase